MHNGSVTAYLTMKYPTIVWYKVINVFVMIAIFCTFPLQLTPAMEVLNEWFGPGCDPKCCSSSSGSTTNSSTSTGTFTGTSNTTSASSNDTRLRGLLSVRRRRQRRRRGHTQIAQQDNNENDDDEFTTVEEEALAEDALAEEALAEEVEIHSSSNSNIISNNNNNGNNKHQMSKSEAALKLQIKDIMQNLNDLRAEQQQRNRNSSSVPTELLDDDCSDSGSVSTLGTMGSTRTTDSTRSKPGSFQFNREMSAKLHCHRKSLCIQDNDCHQSPKDNTSTTTTNDAVVVKSEVDDFVAAFDPNEMRCLALVSHNEMKTTMKEFVIKYKNVLKKFRLTGTNSTMTMLGQVFQGDESVVFGPACSSGPLGGDAELVAMMAQGQLGGILFFQDPMTSHPHQCDIECLVRQALVHNTVIATTPTTAMTIMEVLKLALMGNGRPELLPSFFFSLQSPTVESYKNGQAKVIENRSS
mmetsp:Transcript_45598/g.52700  ORF Transcript_45598/g.52700 Transcript_45598/m.52700 type:complete len:468 (+) Transcript_45598:481-1884(+)